MDFDENKKFPMQSSCPITLNKLAASMPTNDILARVEMVPNCNIAH